MRAVGGPRAAPPARRRFRARRAAAGVAALLLMLVVACGQDGTARQGAPAAPEAGEGPDGASPSGGEEEAASAGAADAPDDARAGNDGGTADAGDPASDADARGGESAGGEPPPSAEPSASEEPQQDSGAAGSPQDGSAAAGTDGLPDDQGRLGAACRTYLRDEVPGLAIEVLHHPGARPADGVVDHVIGALREVVAKPDGVEVIGRRELAGGERTWTADELRALAAEHRSVRTTDQRAAMVVLSVSGEFEQEGVLGVAISATEVVLFPDEVGGLGSGLLGGRAAIERAALLHEIGHLLCLVNLTYASDLDHEDPEHPNHSRHRDSVMHWAIPNDAVTQVFSGPPPDRFHPDDLADLAGLRDGRY